MSNQNTIQEYLDEYKSFTTRVLNSLKQNPDIKQFDGYFTLKTKLDIYCMFLAKKSKKEINKKIENGFKEIAEEMEIVEKKVEIGDYNEQQYIVYCGLLKSAHETLTLLKEVCNEVFYP